VTIPSAGIEKVLAGETSIEQVNRGFYGYLMPRSLSPVEAPGLRANASITARTSPRRRRRRALVFFGQPAASSASSTLDRRIFSIDNPYPPPRVRTAASKKRISAKSIARQGRGAACRAACFRIPRHSRAADH